MRSLFQVFQKAKCPEDHSPAVSREDLPPLHLRLYLQSWKKCGSRLGFKGVLSSQHDGFVKKQHLGKKGNPLRKY